MANKKNTVNPDDSSNQSGTRADGDILKQLQAASARDKDIFSQNEMLLSYSKVIQQSVVNIDSTLLATNKLIDQQTRTMTSIYKLLELWGRRGGITDPAKAGLRLDNNPIGGSGAGQLNNLNSVVRTVQEQTKQTSSIIRDLTEFQKANQSSNQESLKDQKRTLENLLKGDQSTLVNRLEGFRQQNIVTEAQARHSEGKWDSVMMELEKSVIEADSRRMSLSQDFDKASSQFRMNGLEKDALANIQESIGDEIREAFKVDFTNRELDAIKDADVSTADRDFDITKLEAFATKKKFEDMTQTLRDSVQENIGVALRNEFGDRLTDERLFGNAQTGEKGLNDMSFEEANEKFDLKNLLRTDDVEEAFDLMKQRLSTMDEALQGNLPEHIGDAIRSQFGVTFSDDDLQNMLNSSFKNASEQFDLSSLSVSLANHQETRFDSIKDEIQKSLDDSGKTLEEALSSGLGDKLRSSLETTFTDDELATIFNSSFEDAKDKIDVSKLGVGEELESAFGDLKDRMQFVDQDMRSKIEEQTGGKVENIGNSDEMLNKLAVSMKLAEGLKQDNVTAGLVSGGGHALGGLAGEAVSDIAGKAIAGELGTALGAAAGPVGMIVGQIVGSKVEESIGKVADAAAEWINNFANTAIRTRDTVIKASYEKIRADVKDMGTYQVEMYTQATNQIYSVWDKNLSQVTATQGYTKEALNTLQDTVAQKIQDLGYANAINAADYIDTLASALNANLGGELAEVFATQSMILQKAVPEVNLDNMAEQFAAIWTNAVHEGKNGEEEMVKAMEQIAGAAKAIEDTTDGNNQFLKQIPTYLTQAQTMVARAGGSVDQVAELTTQMMAAEGPLASLAPQLSGFTGELVTILADQNNSSAVALRSIMHDIDSNIGISATDFMTSFMDDTKGTLVTAFDAIQQFLDKNQSAGAQQEFYLAMADLFGISQDKLAQIDFGYISEQLAQTNAHLNTAALLDAEALVKDGETETLEQQLVNNTANMLLAQNAVRDTLDNSLMRKLEQNEINMEKLIYEELSVQSVDFAESTMGFFIKLKDALLSLLDPLGIFKGLNSLINVAEAEEINKANYSRATSLSSIGSGVADDAAADRATKINTTDGAETVRWNAALTDGNSWAVQQAMEQKSVAGSFKDMMDRFSDTANRAAESADYDRIASSRETKLGNYDNQVSSKSKAEDNFAAQLSASQDANLAKYEEELAKQEKQYEAIQSINESTTSIDESVEEDFDAMVTELTNASAAVESVQTDVAKTHEWLTDKFWKEFIELVMYPMGEDINKLYQATNGHHSLYNTNTNKELSLLGDLKTNTAPLNSSVQTVTSTLKDIFGGSGSFMKDTNDALRELNSNVQIVNTSVGKVESKVESTSSSIEHKIEGFQSTYVKTSEVLDSKINAMWSLLTKYVETDFPNYQDIFEDQTNMLIDWDEQLYNKIEAFRYEMEKSMKSANESLDNIEGNWKTFIERYPQDVISVETKLKQVSTDLGTVDSSISRLDGNMQNQFSWLKDNDGNSIKGIINKLNETQFNYNSFGTKLKEQVTDQLAVKLDNVHRAIATLVELMQGFMDLNGLNRPRTGGSEYDRIIGGPGLY